MENNKLKLIERWASGKGLGFIPDKTDLVLFTRKYKMPSLQLPAIGNTMLKLGESAKYLGVVQHKKKATVALYSCKVTIGCSRGLSPNAMHAYFAIGSCNLVAMSQHKSNKTSTLKGAKNCVALQLWDATCNSLRGNVRPSQHSANRDCWKTISGARRLEAAEINQLESQSGWPHCNSKKYWPAMHGLPST